LRVVLNYANLRILPVIAVVAASLMKQRPVGGKTGLLGEGEELSPLVLFRLLK